MNKDEFLKRFNINKIQLKRYIKANIINEETELNEKDAEVIGLVMSIEQMGFSISVIKKYISLLGNKDKYHKEIINLLTSQRKLILDRVHLEQKNLDQIDYMIFEIKKEENHN